MYLGNFKQGQTIEFKFNTCKLDGTPITLSGSPVICVYKNSVTETTSGVSPIYDFDSIIGFHYVSVNTSTNPSFYSSGNDFNVVVQTGTVDGTDVSGSIIASFSLENRFINQAFDEPAQGSPAASATIVEKISYLYKAWRNKKTQTASQYSLFSDDGVTVDQKASVSDNGTTTTIEEIGSGP